MRSDRPAQGDSLGIALTTGRIGSRAARGAWSWSEGEPLRRGGLLAGTGAALAVAAFIWWPNGDYRPIQPGERGTLAGAIQTLRDIPGGRPSLTAEREHELGGAPSERERRRAADQKLELQERGPAQGDAPEERDGNEPGQGLAEEPGAPNPAEPVEPTEEPQEELPPESQPAPGAEDQTPPAAQENTSTAPEDTTEPTTTEPAPTEPTTTEPTTTTP